MGAMAAMIDEYALTPFQIMLGILAAAPQGMTTSEVAEATRETSYNAAGRLKKMWRRGLIEQMKKGGKARWSLPPKRLSADQERSSSARIARR